MAAEVGASAAAQQQIALPPEGADITNIQDEDLLRRMWQATEDFGRKKEIRARMYKLREQRLKEFYTTGEVLSDLMSTTLDGSTSAAESSANNGSTIVTTRRTTYAASESGDSVGGGLVVTTTETIRGAGGSQESLIIRYRSGGNEDENLKNIEMDRRQLQGSSELIYESGGKTTRSTRSAMSSSNQSSAMITKSSSYGLHSQSLADQGFLTMKSKEIRDSESPTRDFSHLHNRQITTSTTHGAPGSGGYWYEESRSYQTGDDGAEVVQYGTRGGQQAFSSSSVIEYGDGGSTACRTGETALTSEQMSSSTKKEVSSSHQERSASSSYSFSSSSTQDWVQKHQDDESFVHDHSQPLQIESVRSGAYEESAVKEKESIDGRSSVHVEHTSKTERVSDIAENETRIKKEETESRRTTTEKFEELESKEEPRGPKQKVTQRSKTGELPLEVNITKQVTTEITSSVPSTATSTPLPDSGPTPDVGSWTVVSGKQNGVSSSTDEFVFRSGTTTETSSTRDTTQRITTTDSTNDSTVIIDTQNVTSDLSSTVKPSYSVPAAGKPTTVDSPVTSPSVEIKGIMKQTTTTTTTTSTPQAPTQSNYYVQTKRISTEVSPTHDAFARSLRASPEKTQTYSTRASSKSSIDTNTTILSSPTRPQRMSVTSPTGRSSSPEKGSQRPRDRCSPMKQQTPSPSASKEKRKLSSSLSKGIGGKRTATPGASPSVSPVRGRSPCSDEDEPRRRVGTSPEKKKTVTREGSPFSEPSRGSPGKETKSSLRKTPEKSPARDTPDCIPESPRRKSSETTITKETKTTTSVGRRPSKGPKEERPAVRKPSSDRLTSPASSPMKDKSPDFPKEKKPGDDKTPTSPQRPKDLDLKTRPTTEAKRTPSSPLEKSPMKQKDHDKPKEEKRKPSKDSTEPQNITHLDKDSPKTHRVSKADQPEEQFEVVCEAPETFDVKIITPIIHSVEYPTDEPEKRTKKTTVEEDTVSKKIEHELEIERLKRPSNIPVVIPTEEDAPQKATGKTPTGITPTEEKDSESPREPKDSSKKAPEAPDTDSPAFRPTRKDSQPRKSPSKEEIKPTDEFQRRKSPSPVSEVMKSSKKSPIRDSPVRDTQYRQSPSPSRDSPIRETKRPASPEATPSRKSPARDSPRASSSSPAREIQRKQSPSPARDMPSSKSPMRESPKKSPSPAKNLPKSFSPSRQSPARGSPARDSPRKASPSRDDDSPKTYPPTRKQCTRDSPVRESTRKHSPSPAKELPEKGYPRRHSPSPAKEFPEKGHPRRHSPSPAKEFPEKGYPRRHSPSPAKESPTRKSPARESPLRESTRQQSPSPARETSAKRPFGKSPDRDALRKSQERDALRKSPERDALRKSPERDGLRKSPARDTPTKPSKERQSPFRRRPEEKPSPEKSPARKPSIKDSSRKDSPVKKIPERETMGKSPVRQSPSRDIRSKTPERESPKKTPTKPSPAKEAPRRDSSPKKLCDHDLSKKPSLTRKASDKVIPKRDTIARRSQSTEIPAAKRASPFKDSPKADDIPQRRAPATPSPVRKSPPKESSVRKIPQYSSPVRTPIDSTIGDSPNANKPCRQTPVKAAPKDTPVTPAKTPVKEYAPSGIPRTMSPARRPLATDSLPSSPDSPRQREGRSQPSTSSPEKSPPSQRPSRSPERAPARKQPETSKPVSRIPGRAPASNITPPSQKRQAPTSSIPSYTTPLRRTPKDDCCLHHTMDSPKTEPKGSISRPQPGSRIPESNARRPGESSVDKKSTKLATTAVRKAKKPKKQRPLSGTDSEEEISSTETEDDEKECVEERVTVTEKEVRSVSEVFMQDISDNHYPLQNGGVPDRPVSLSLITTATKTVTSGEEVQQTIDSEGNVTMTTYKQPSTITMSVSCKNTDYDGKEVTHTVRKTTYPDQPDEDEDVEILEIDDDDDSKQIQAIEYPYDEESPKVPKQAPTQTTPKRFGSPAKPIKKETKSQLGTGRRPTTESPVRRQPNDLEPVKKRYPATATPSSPKQPTTAKAPSSAPKKPTQPIYEPQDENTSPKSPRKPGQISRLPAKQAPRQETRKVTSITGKTSLQKGRTAVTTMVSSTARQKSTFVSSTVEKTQSRQPLKGAPQPKQMKPAPKGKIPQKTSKGIPVKDTKKRVTNGHVPHSIEPEEDDTEEEIDERETPLVSDVEKTEKYYEEEDIMDEERDTISVHKFGPKLVEEKPHGLHPSTAFTAVTGIQTTTEIRQVSRESTPDAPGRRPRYADRVSEPDDDDVYYEEKGLTRTTKRDQEIIGKKSVDQIERTVTVTMPRLEMVEQRYEEDEELREFEKTEIEQRRQMRMEQVTDLDEDEPKPENEDDIEPANLSVASKVSRFLTASASAAAPPQPSQVPRMEPRGARRPSWEPDDSPRQPKGDEVDQKNYKTEELSSVAVKRARDIFETIAKTPSTLEPTPTTPKLKTDVLGKASLFETKQVDEINRIRTTQTLRKSFTGSDESLGEEGLPKEKPCTDYTESEEDYDEEPIEQIKESPIKKSQPKDTTPYKPQFERDLPRESSPGRTFKIQPEKDVPKETSPSRTFKPLSDKEAPKEPIRKTSKPLAEKPGAPKEKPSLRDEIYDEPSDGEVPEGEKPKKTTPYESLPKTHEPSSPKTTDTDAARRKNIFRDGTTPKEDEQAPKVKKTSIGSGMGREAFLKRMSKFASTEETKTVSTVKESPKIKPVSKFPSKIERDEPTRRPSKDGETPSRRVSTDSPTRRISRDEPECRRSPARDVSKPSTDTYTRRPSRDQPKSELESPRRTPTRETPSQSSESPRRTDTYTRKTSKEINRNELESPRRTPTRETPTQQSETPKRLSTDTFTKRPRDRPTGDTESPRKTPTREMPSPARKPQEERRPSTDTSRRLSREFPKEDESPKDERPKGATFTRRPSKDRVREEEAPKRPQDGTFTRKPKITEDDSPRPDESYPRGSDTFTRRPSKDRQSPKRDSPMRAPEEDSPRSTGTYTRRTSTERFKESSSSPRSSPARDSQPKKPEESPRRPSQDRSAGDKRRGSDTFTRRRSQPREDEPKKPESAVDALKPYLRTRTQEFQDDDIKLKPDDKTPKKLSSSRFETFTKRDSSTSVTKDDTKRLVPVSADRSPKKLSGSRFETFTKRDSATSVKATESVVSRTKTTTRKSVERELETQEDRLEYEDSPKYYPEESPARSERKTPERAPEKIDKRPAERVERTPDRKTPDRKTPDRRDDSPASFGEPLRKKPSKEVEDEPVRKAPRPDDEEVEPRTSSRRRPSKEGSPRPEVKPDDEIPEQQRRRSSGGKFGVVLRQSSTVGSRVEALLSKVEKRTGSTTVTLTPTKRRPSKGPDSALEIEEIFDLEFLEQMLEKATDYDQRRRIRAQIRIVRRGEGRPEPGVKEAPKEREPTRPSTLVSKTKTPTPSAPPADELDAEEERKGKPRRPSQTRESPEKVPSLTRKPSRAEEVGGELTSPSVVAKLLPSNTSGTPSSRPSPSSTPKKNSLTSSSGLPREACPTDSITSSYGVGPTDESGRPLFGLRALRRPQQQPPDSLPSAPAPSPITQSREASLEPRPQSPETSDVRDSSGRPLFGLRAITISSTSNTTKEGRRVIERSKSPETGERSSSPSEDLVQTRDMPSTSTASTTETSVHLRDLVRRHEQHARGNVPSQPVAPVQKPKAKLRDSFILPQHSLDDEEEDVVEEGRPVDTTKAFPSALPSSVAESGKIVAERSTTLKSIIQKHEKNTDSEYTNDKLNRRDSGLGAYTEEEELVPAKNNYCRRAQDYSTDEDEEDDFDDEEYQQIENGQRQESTTVKVTSDVVRRPGILKKPKDEITESTSTTSSTIRSQHSEKSGYVSLKKDVIQSGEDSEGAVDDDEEVVSTGKGRTPKGSTGRRPSNDQDEAPSSRATYSSYTTSSSSSSVARSGCDVERRRSSTSTPYRVEEDDGDSNDGIEVIRSPSDNRFSSTTTTVTRRVVSGSESPKVVTTTTTVKRSTGRPDEEQTEVLVQDSSSSSARKKLEQPSASPSPAAAFPRITRGGSVRALSQKFQQAAEAASGGPDSPSRTYPKAGLIFRTASFRQTSSPPHTPVHSPSAPCIPSTPNVNGHAGTKTTVGEERRTSINESDYSQQIRRRSVENDRGSSPTSRRSAEITTVSRQPIVDEYDDQEAQSVTVEQRTVVVTNGSAGSRSFLGNQTKVTGVQDVLSRMREADNEGPAEGDTVEDSEARALLNKFLGAQVILQGMEPLINAQSPSLVRQVEKQRVQKKQESATVVYSSDIDLDGIWDERRLRQLLESCSDYDGRRKIRARIRTVMAEQKVTAEIVAEGRLEAEREESARSKAIVSKQTDDGQMETSTTVLRSVQGELLPLIVDQLKTSLERGEGLGGGPLTGFRISSSSSEEGPFDSGTESGDDRRNQRRRRVQQQQLTREEIAGGEEGDAEDEEEEDEDIQMPHGEFSSFMEGLKTSIEEAAARRKRERAPGVGEDSEGTQRENKMEKQFVNNNKKGVAGVEGELLSEVHTALDKLHGTLQTSSGLDPEKSQALISLISRLQTSLEEEQKNRKENQPEVIPPPAAPPPRTVVPDWKARCQRKRQGRAHTVGVSQEELEDARRLLQSQEKEKEEEEKGQTGEKEEGNQIISSISPAAVGECKSYSLMKQSSAGDLAPPSWATNSVAARVFRPVRFEPRNSPSWASMFNKTAKPFQREALGKNPPQAPKYPICPPPLPPPPAQPQLAPPSVASRSLNVQKAPEPFGSVTTPEATQKPPEIPPKPSFDSPSAVSYLSQNHYVPPPATAPAVPRSPTGPPTWQSPYSPNPPTLSSSGTSSGTTGLSHRDSESSISGSVSTKTEDEEDERPVKEVQVNGVTAEEESDDENESEEVTQVTQKEVKPYTNGVSSYGVRIIEPLLATASEFRPSEKRSVHHSLSLDSGTKRSQEDTLTTPGDVGKRASPLARSWTLDDPSALLFTQAESVQIAVHKAAIKKQLTQEEEQRMRLPLRPQNGLGEKAARSQSTTEEDATPIGDGGVAQGPVVAREAAGSDSYGECGSDVRINGDGHVHRTTSGSSVSSVASSRNSATAPNGIYVLNSGNENQNPSVPPRRESIPAANSYENNAGGNTRDFENANGDRAWTQNKSQGTPVGSGQKGYQNGSNDRREFPKENSAERYRESADDELAQLHSQMSNQSRQQSKVEKKRRMKRANTIDIPKPLNFYMDEDDFSSGEEMEDDGEVKEDGSSGLSGHRAAYLALRGPIRVKIPQSKPLAPSFQAKTENDRKFLAFLEQHSGHKPDRAEVQPIYHSSARGGAHWSNRFSNIKTTFEGSGRGSEHNVGYGRGRGMGRNSLGEIGGPASARNFWRAADDSVTRSRGSSHGPRLSREGSTLLRRLFEERDAAAAENNGKADRRAPEPVAKLPWTAETQAKGDDSVVIGSLTVASKKQLFSAMKAAPPEVKGPVPVGKFSHAPLSAFRPIHSKDQSIVPAQGPLSSPGAVRLASQKFGAPPAAKPAKPQNSHVPLGTKSPHNSRVAFVTAQESHSPVGGPPPWAKDDAHDRVHSTSALFETRTRDPSPPPMSFTSHTVAHSQVYNPVQFGQPMGGVPQAPSIVQPHYMDHSQAAALHQPNRVTQTTVPTPPPRSNVPRAPMIQPPTQSHSPPPPALPPPPVYAGPSPPMVTMPIQAQPPTPPKPVYRQPSPPLHSPTVVYREATPPPVVPPFPKTNVEPPSPEPELQCAAVTKVMTGPVFQQAVVQKRRRGGEDEEEEEEGRESAARNLSSALHRLSVSPSRPPRTTPPCPPKPIDYPKEQSSDTGRVFSSETYLHPSHASLIGENQSVHNRGSTSHSPLPTPEVVSPQNTDRKTEERNIPEKLSLREQEEFYQKQLQAVREAQEARRRYEEAQRESYKRTSKSYTHDNLVSPPNKYQHASLTTDTREENNESVVTMRLQIPVKEPEHYNSHLTTHSLSPVQRGMGAIRSNSHHDVRHALASVSPVQQRVESPRRDTEDRSPTSVLQKSESWHMLGQLGQSGQGSKRPQSVALDQSKRRAPPSLPKMSFPKQFEARLSPETVESKQKKVEAYLKGQALGSKSVSGTNSPSKLKMVASEPMTPLLLDDNLENVDEAFESLFNAATKAQDKRLAAEKGQGSSKDQWSPKGLQKSQSQHLLRPPAPPRESSASPQFQRKQKAWEESCMVKTKLAQNISGSHSEATSMSSSTESSVTKTEVHSKTSNYSATVTGKSRVSKAPPSKTMSPFAKFKQLDEQNAGSSPNSPKSPGGTGPLFKFTDPQLSRSASGVKDKLLYWCQVKTKEYKNIQIENFSTSWSNGLAFCALIHHFCPDAFDYDTLRPEERRKNFDLAFRVADEKAGIAPLLDVEDMVTMRKPDWKCVFTYVQSIYRRFKDED